MAGKAEFAGDARSLIAGGHRREGDARIHHVAFDAVETPEKIEMPPGAAKFAVGDCVQPDRLLLPDDRLDLAIFYFAQRRGGDLFFGAALARRLQRGRP
jgi:hypothetical protein